MGFCLVVLAVGVASDPAHGTSVDREKLAASLAQAEIAWRQIGNRATPAAELAEAQARYGAATAAAIDALNAPGSGFGNEPAWNWQAPGATHIQAGDYLLELASPEIIPGAWKRDVFDRVETIHHPYRNPAVPAGLRPGIGVPVLAIRKATDARLREEPGLPRRGYYLPATAVLVFSAADKPGGTDALRSRIVQLEILDPRQALALRVGERGSLPVAADFATPVNEEVGTHVFGHLSFLGFFRPQRALEYSGLYTFGPFDPDKIPVVFIHGLNSDPSIWGNATTDLIADPDLGSRCQFWYFFYPTGVPAIASARRLREALDRMRAVYDPAGKDPNLDKLILVGHSMGGLLAHLLMIDSGSAFYDAYFAAPLDKLDVPPETRAAIQRNLFFTARRDVDEAIFICTPHRGSRLADWGVVRLLSKLIAIPRDILEVSTQVLTLNVALLNPALRESGLPGFSVIDSLSPRNPYFRAIEKQTIQKPYYSIIGDRGRGDTPNSSDGVVGYRSSHWEGARAERIVPFGHSCTRRPMVFEAVHQLIQQELAGKKRAVSTTQKKALN